MATDIWTVQAALNWCQGYLERHDDPNPRLSAQWLLAHATGLSRIEVYTNFDKPLSLEERDILRDAVRRRGAGEPLQYIQSQAPFRYLMVKVRPGVLIPRPETEVLVEEALAFVDECAGQRGEGSFVDVVDCCTGSGCIACSIATERLNVRVTATDISPVAVEVARENVEACEASREEDAPSVADRMRVLECDLLSALDDESADVIVSNPPYIPTAVMAELPQEVAAHEPELALEGGEDGLDIYRRMLPEMQRVLRPGGAFALELHETCLGAAAQLAEEAGFRAVRVVKDLVGRPRILTARR